MLVTTPSLPHRTTSPSPSSTTTSSTPEESLNSMSGCYPPEISVSTCSRVVRFDSECVLIPELSKIKRPLMVTRSYAIPLWKKRATSGESSAEENQDSPSSSPTMGGVVFKLPLPSFMAKPTRSPSRTRECSRPPCLINSTDRDPSHPHSIHSRQRRVSNPTSFPSNALPNPILVVDTHHNPPLSPATSLPLSSTSPTAPGFSEATTPSGSSGGTKTPINRSPTIPFHFPSGLAATTPSTENPNPSAGSFQKEKHGGNSKDKDREREKDKDKDKIVTVPLRACCPDCFPTTEECVRNGDQWKERFSKGARRRRGSSVSSASSSEAGDDLGVYSPLASYKPLRESAEEKKDWEKVEEKLNHNSNCQVGVPPPTSTSTTASVIGDDDDEEVVSALSLKVRVDEVDCIRGSSLRRLKRQPSLEQMDTEDDEISHLQPRGRDTSSSSIGSASSTFSAMSGVSSASSNTGTEEPANSAPLALESSSTCDPLHLSAPSHDQPSPSSPTSPPSSYTMATRGKRRRKPSAPIKEDEEPPEERYEGYCRDRERGRSRRDNHRLRALKIRNLGGDDDDVNMLFPLPSPRRSPSTSPLSTPQGSATPTNGGSVTPSPNPSPTPSSSAVHLLNTNAPKKRSRLGVNEIKDPESGPLHEAAQDEIEADVETREEERGSCHAGDTRKEPSVLPWSIKRKEKEHPPSIAKAAEIALAQTEAEVEEVDEGGVGNGSLGLAEEDEWVKIRGNGHLKTASEPGSIGSLKEKKVPSVLPPPPSTTTQTQPSSPLQTSSSAQVRSQPEGNKSQPPPPPPTASRPQKQQRRSSLRAGAFLEIFRSVPGITP